MANIVYARPSENLTSLATITVQSGTEDPDYPAANLADGNPAKPAKLTTTTGAWVFDFGSAKQIDLVALIHHNLDAGLNVRIQANSSSAWTSPPLDQAITIPADHEDGYPVNPWVDLTGIGTRTYQYWRLAVLAANSVAIAVGEVVLAAPKRSLEVNVSWGASVEEARALVEHRTEYGVSTVYDLNVKTRRFVGEVDTTDAGAQSLLSLARDAKTRFRPWLFVPDPSANEAWLVRWAEPKLPRQLAFLNRNLMPFAVDEVSRGLPL